MPAVVLIGKSQYIINPGQELLVDKISGIEKDVTLPKVILYWDDKEVIVGKPYLDKVLINASNMGIVKGDKIRVSKYKAKSRYRKTIGFRPQYSRIKIDNLTSVKK